MRLIVDYSDQEPTTLLVDDRFASGRDLIAVARRLHDMIPGATCVRWLYPGGSVDSTTTAADPGAATLQKATARILATRAADDLATPPDARC